MDLPDTSLAAIRYNPLAPTIFHQPWWLEAVTGGDYQSVSVHAGGREVGRLPFVLNRMLAGQSLCTMPELTHFLGPGIDAGNGAAANRALKHDAILRELLAQLPAKSGFYQKLHRGVADTLVFQDHGYRTAVQFTFEIAPAPVADIWRAMRDKTRNVIRRAAEQYEVADLPDPAAFASMYAENLRQRGLANHYRRIAALTEAALLRDQGRIISARDAAGRQVAAIFYVWDASTAYYLLSTRTADAGNSAVSVLVWHAMQDAALRGLVFDFDGVAAPGSRVFYTGFGGKVSPRYIVSRYSLMHRLSGRLSNPFPRRQSQTYQW